MFQDVLESLLVNLGKQQSLYARLLEVAEQKRQDLLRNDIAGLRQDLQEEERLAADGTRLNEEHDVLHGRCIRMLNLSGKARTLEDICRSLPREWSNRFEKVRSGLRHTLSRLQEVNRMNAALVNNSLEFLEGLLAALFNVEPAAAYGPKGIRTQTQLAAQSLDARA